MELRNICKSYDGVSVLEDISLEIEEGGRYVISAPSGRGKTTLLRIMMGLEQPDGGELTGISGSISAVFQEDRLPAEFSTFRCVKMALPGRVSKTVGREHLAELGLGEHTEKPAKELSGGMKRRVALCRAVLSGADTIYLDEPFTGLDTETKKSVAGYINRHCRGRTLVVVSHSSEDAMLLNAKEIRI